MLAPAKVEEVERLLASGEHSQRTIAKMTGVSRGSVGAIAGGKRHIYPRNVKPEFPDPEGPPERCPKCGGLTPLPCRLCYVRKKRGKSPPKWDTLRDAPLGLQLKGEPLARYEEVRRWRRMNAGVARPFEEGFYEMLESGDQ